MTELAPVEVNTTDHVATLAAPIPYHVVKGLAPANGVREPVGYATAIPDKLTTEAHVIIVNGYFAFKQTSTGLARELAGMGIPVTTFSPGRVHSEWRTTLQHLRDPQQLHVASLVGVDQHMRSNIEYADVPNGLRVARAARIILGHSMGVMAAVRFAEAYPARVDTVISMEGVGQQGALGVVAAVARTAKVAGDVGTNIARGKFNNYGLNAIAKATYHTVRNPGRTVAEGVSCIYADMRPHIRRLAALSINYEIVTGEYDAYFPPDEVEPVVRDTSANYSVMAGATHIAPQVRPRPTAEHCAALIL